jgi:hypothetical protein
VLLTEAGEDAVAFFSSLLTDPVCATVASAPKFPPSAAVARTVVGAPRMTDTSTAVAGGAAAPGLRGGGMSAPLLVRPPPVAGAPSSPAADAAEEREVP